MVSKTPGPITYFRSDPPGECPWSTINQSYEAVRELSRGTASAVYLVQDRARGDMLTAFKVFRLENRRAWKDGQREFEVLRRLHHPQIAEVYDFGRIETLSTAPSAAKNSQAMWSPRIGDAFLSSEYVVGLDLRRAFLRLFPFAAGGHVGASGYGIPSAEGADTETELAGERQTTGCGHLESSDSLDSCWRVFYQAIARIALGLDAIHSNGLVHHDIKPENLILVPTLAAAAPASLDARIIDFGFVKEETTPLGREIRGTVPFIAPEVLLQSFADGRSDLYSLGISLVHAMTGSFPFPTGRVEDWLEFLRSNGRFDLAPMMPWVPSEFVQILEELTCIDPGERISRAMALVDRLEAAGKFSLVERAECLQHRVPVVGWERELSLVRGEIESLQVGESGYTLILLETDAESYVDRFVEELEILATVSETTCLRGRGRWLSRYPYQPLAEILVQLRRKLDLSAPPYRRFGEILSRLVPEFGSERPESTEPAVYNSDPKEGRLRLIESLTNLLVQVGKESPTVVLVEDLDLADEDTLALIRALAQNLAAGERAEKDALIGGDLAAESSSQPTSDSVSKSVPSIAVAGNRVLIVGVYRTGGDQSANSVLEECGFRRQEEPSSLKDLATLGCCLKLKIKPLDLENVRDWLAQRYRGVSVAPTAVRRLFERSGGRSRLLDELFRAEHLDDRARPEMPIGVRDSDSEKALLSQPGSYDADFSLNFPGNLGEILINKLPSLPEDALQLLEVLAVAGPAIGIHALHSVVTSADPALGTQPWSLGRQATSAENLSKCLEKLSNQLRDLVDLGLIDLREGPGGTEAFWSHGGPRSHVYSRLASERRLSLHRLFLKLLLADPLGKTTEEAAYHAFSSDQFDEFVSCAMAAAKRYVNAFSFPPAIRLYEGILRHLNLSDGRSSIESEPEDVEKVEGVKEEETSRTSAAYGHRERKRWEVLSELGKTYRLYGDHPEAIEQFTVLLSLTETEANVKRRAAILRTLGELYDEKKDHGNAHYFLQKSVRLLADMPGENETIEALLSLSRFNYQRGEYLQAEVSAMRALDAIGKDSDPDICSRIYLQIGKIYSKRNDYDRSLQYHQKAMEVARDSCELPRVLQITEALGVTYMARGEYDKATEQFARGVELATLLGSKRSLAKLHNQMGTIQFNRANHVEALENFERSLRLWQEIGNPRGIANSYNNIGLALCLKDDLRRAEKCYLRAIEIFSRQGDEYGQAAGMNNLANILELEGKYRDALDYAFRSLEKRKRFNSRLGIAYSYYSIGKIYQSSGELDKASSYAEKSLKIRRDVGDKMGIAYSKVQLADLLCLQGKLHQALRTCEEGEKDFELLENDYGCLVTQEIRARLLLQTGAVEKAVKLLDQLLVQARQRHQELLVGKALLVLGRAFTELEEFREAEIRFDRAEAIFRESRSRRQLIELLLEKCRLFLNLGNLEQASTQLETAYDLLEEVGIRDLIPCYFLLRGRLEVERHPPSFERGNKFLQRALVEARETSLPDIHWQVLFRLGLLYQTHQAKTTDGQQDPENLTDGHEYLSKALETLQGMGKDLPGDWRTEFFQLEERRLLKRALATWSERSNTATPSGPKSAGKPNRSRRPETGEGADVATRPEADFDTASCLEDELRQERVLNKRLLKLQEINKAINSERDLQRLLEKVMDAVLDLMDAERGFLIVKLSGEPEEIRVARNIARKTVDEPEKMISRSISAEVIKTGRPVLTTSAISDNRFLSSKSVQDLRLLSVLCVPLRSHNRILGVIYLDNRTRLHAFEDADLKILETFCDQATTAIMNAKLSKELHARNSQLTEVNRQLEALNHRLLDQVEARNNELEMTRERMRKQLNEYESHLRFHNIIGKTKPMQQIFQVLERISPTNLPVLIQGDSGTGKELVARAIHVTSNRKEQRFVSENCAALSESLLESELFGHIRGAFTGATAERKGLFEIANGGTLLLDEVAEMSLSMQTKLLRVLEEGELRKVGDKRTVKIDVRIISSSNRDLRTLVEKGEFREDLYYRLNGVRIELPRLRERKKDIPLLARHFLEQIARETGLPKKEVTHGALRKLMSHDWPGNVRELKHFLERTVLLAEGQTLRVEDCRFDDSPDESYSSDDERDAVLSTIVRKPLREARDVFTEYYVRRCYAASGYNATQAADACGMSRESFHRFLKKYDIRKEKSRSEVGSVSHRGAPSSPPDEP